MTGRLIWKLLAISVLIIGFVMVIVWLALDYLAADYFAALMAEYNISPTSSHRMFVDAVHRYLIWAGLAALALAVALSFLLMRKLLGPLTQMTVLAEKIAAGDYSGQIPIASRDEVGQLAEAFNRMAEGLRRLEGLRKTMVLDVAHELRTPLTNIRGYLEALRDEVLPASPETFHLLHEEALRLVHLVEDLLRLARADAARTNLHKEEISLVDVIAQALERFESKLEERGIRVETHFAKGTDRIGADPSRLVEVIENLLQNAVQYTPSGGRLRIAIERPSQPMRVTFANTGGEITERDVPFLFERFYRGEKSRSREYGGAGIGLAIVKQLVEAHGGQVGAEISEGETRIWFSLPA